MARTQKYDLSKEANVTKEEMKKIMGGYNIPMPKKGTLVGNPGTASGANKFIDFFFELDHFEFSSDG